MPNQIRTLLRHECTLAATQKDRGARQWSAAQVMTSTWFFIECCEEHEQDIQRWVTNSFKEAADIQKSLGPSGWARFFICLRAPVSIREASLFEEVDETYEVIACGSYLFQLATGLSYVVGTKTVREVWSKPQELQLLYKRKSVRYRGAEVNQTTNTFKKNLAEDGIWGYAPVVANEKKSMWVQK